MEKYLIAGLGNPGAQFLHTRHNLGIRIVGAWYEVTQSGAVSVRTWHDNIQLECEIAEIVVGDLRLICIFPLTFMNVSGMAVAAVMKKYSIESNHVLLVHDDLELPFGEVQQSQGGSAKGHNGIRSIYERTGSQDFLRLRVGIGRPPQGIPVNQFVLMPFTRLEEQELQEEIIPRAVKMVPEVLGD